MSSRSDQNVIAGRVRQGKTNSQGILNDVEVSAGGRGTATSAGEVVSTSIVAWIGLALEGTGGRVFSIVSGGWNSLTRGCRAFIHCCVQSTGT